MSGKARKTDANKKKLKRKVITDDCKRCKPITTSNPTPKESYPCNECRQNLEIQTAAGKDCLYDSETDIEPWYLQALLSGSRAPPKFKKVFPKKIIRRATEKQCGGSVFDENWSESDEETEDPCNPVRKQNSVKSKKQTANCCKCPPRKVNTRDAAKKCIGHFLIEDDNAQQRKKSKIPVRKEKPVGKSWSRKLPCNCPVIDLEKAVEGAAVEKFICCTEFSEESRTVKPGNAKKSKRKKPISKKVAQDCSDCSCTENKDRAIDSHKKTRKLLKIINSNAEQ